MKSKYFIAIFLTVFLLSCKIYFKGGMHIANNIDPKAPGLEQDISTGLIYIEKLPESDAEYKNQRDRCLVSVLDQDFYQSNKKKNRKLLKAFSRYPFRFEIVPYGTKPEVKDPTVLTYYLRFHKGETIVSYRYVNYIRTPNFLDYKILALENLNYSIITNYYTIFDLDKFAPNFIRSVIRRSKQHDTTSK
ncbi:MAG: hypothetical protein JNM95_02555 [Chitinophagaceae bacterium]|nr:hypothetical protein [Chitinophagaceae bacterium]